MDTQTVLSIASILASVALGLLIYLLSKRDTERRRREDQLAEAKAETEKVQRDAIVAAIDAGREANSKEHAAVIVALEGVQGKVEVVQSDVGALKTDVAVALTRIGAAEKDIDKLEEAVTD